MDNTHSTCASESLVETSFEHQKVLKLKIANDIPVEEYQASVSISSLMDIGALNNSWVLVSVIPRFVRIENDDSKTVSDKITEIQNNAKKHLLQLKVLDCLSMDDSQCKVAENGTLSVKCDMAFNLCEEDIQCYRSLCHGDRIRVYVELYSNMVADLPYTRNVSIALVKSPANTNEIDDDDALRQYFNKRRLLKVGYQFYVEAGQTGFVRTAVKSTNVRRFYKVLSMDNVDKASGAAWVKKNESTTLCVSGSTNAFVRSSLFETKEDSVKNGAVSFISGLEKYLFELSNLIKPSLLRVHPAENTVLVHGPAGIGKRTIVRKLCEELCMHFVEENCFNIMGDSISAMEQRIQNLFQNAVDCAPSVLLFRNAHALCKDKDGQKSEPRLVSTFLKCLCEIKSTYPVVTIAATNTYKELSEEVINCFIYEYEISPPNEAERENMFTGLTTCLHADFSSEVIAKKTAGFVLGDFCYLTSLLQTCAQSKESCKREQKTSVESSESDHCFRPGSRIVSNHDFSIKEEDSTCLKRNLQISQRDVDSALDIIRSNRSVGSDLPKIPDVSWDDVGGLAEVKSLILDTIQLPLEHPELISSGLTRSGLLLYGPPGCGKTLLAKAVATEFSLNFLSVKGPELINMYVGQSEENIREVFKKGRQAAPCVIFFDELDSLAPNRGRSGDSGGVMDRVVSQLLAELDGMETNNNLFVIGATNRPDLLDPALLRPGRFDRTVFVGHPNTKEDRLRILLALTRKICLGEDVVLENIEQNCPTVMTGADFYALCSDAVLNAIRRKIQTKTLENLSCQNENHESESLTLMMDDFLEAVKNLVPSLSVKDLSKYAEFRNKTI